ncbi:hypothetical protein BDY17DRAFT_71207 [Neohortaea acidophila]|uniref:Uncharacterized protein n=1 Tax=Neohortaea acidophila TaxID=245834 RepID=A0A6A6Q2A1_9PEZI|nr:uncharacterized protein BDY17DRAFT_71207 [Neohortaea acidophila]KAF2486119.1 hypothetical protein BDY17DRAFT_71207 [Neohortaea acidophila]
MATFISRPAHFLVSTTSILCSTTTLPYLTPLVTSESEPEALGGWMGFLRSCLPPPSFIPALHLHHQLARVSIGESHWPRRASPSPHPAVPQSFAPFPALHGPVLSTSSSQERRGIPGGDVAAVA